MFTLYNVRYCVSVLLNNCKQSITSLALLVGTIVVFPSCLLHLFCISPRHGVINRVSATPDSASAIQLSTPVLLFTLITLPQGHSVMAEPIYSMFMLFKMFNSYICLCFPIVTVVYA